HDRLGLEPGFAGTFGFRVREVLTVFIVCFLTIEDRRKRNVDGGVALVGTEMSLLIEDNDGHVLI
ncbi:MULTISPECIES: hypothetical protein, partial [Rhizobium/Agrobacterium group]|uniref:hypothetical protein n=1 Tax=Rhizobium/Agrobacterium group TaxID=227290 RepID=UPI001AECCBB5